jgi:hypothetical protein
MPESPSFRKLCFLLYFFCCYSIAPLLACLKLLVTPFGGFFSMQRLLTMTQRSVPVVFMHLLSSFLPGWWMVGGGGTTLELILCLTGADVGSVTDCFDSHTDNRHINHCGCWEPGDPAIGATQYTGDPRLGATQYTGAQLGATQGHSQYSF